MRQLIYIALLSIMLAACGESSAAILVMEPGGTYTVKKTLSEVAVAPSAAGKTIVVTSALTAVQSNISSATLPGGAWPTDRALKIAKGGSLGNTTVFKVGTVETTGDYRIFAGTGRIEGLSQATPDMWGADGVSDQVEINKAIKAVAAGGTLKGTDRLYIINAVVDAYRDDITLKGLRIKFKDYAVAGNDTSFTGIQASGDRMLIEDCYVDGNRYNQSWGYETAGWSGVFDWSKNANYGISVTGDDCMIRRNYVTRVTANSMGVPTLGKRNVFDGNTGTDAGKKGLYLGEVSGVTVTNNWFYENKHDAGIGLRASSNVIIKGNHCFKNYYGIYAGETNLGFGGTKIAITGNDCYDNGVNNVFIAQYWDAPEGYYEGTNPTPTQGEWDATGLNDIAVKQDAIVANNHLYHTPASATRANSTEYSAGDLVKWDSGTTVWECTTAGTSAGSTPSIATDGEAGGAKVIGQSVTDGSVVWIMRGTSNTKYNLEIYNAGNNLVSENIVEEGGVLAYNSKNSDFVNNYFIKRSSDTATYMIRLSGYPSTGSHPNHLIVSGTRIKNNRFELQNVTNAIYMDLTTDTDIFGNKFEVLGGGTYEIRIVDSVSVANTTINQIGGRVKLGTAATLTNGYVTGATLTGTTGSIGGGALAAGACTSGALTVTGAATGMTASASPVTYPGDGAYWSAHVSATDTVTVKVCGAIALTPTASAYNVRVVQ